MNERENKARAGLEALRRELPALEQAVDEARNEMLPLIDDAAEGWAARLAVEAEEAQARYRAAVEEALGALGEAERSYSAVDFLRAFQPADARMGLAPGWHGKPMRLVTEDPWGNQENPRELLSKASAAAPRINREEVRARRDREAQEAREAELAELREVRGR